MKPILTLTVERYVGLPSTTRDGMQVEEIADAVTDLRGDRDVTLTISVEGRLDERLLVGVDGSLAFLGLDRVERDGNIYQFTRHQGGSERQTFNIGGQPTEMESKYLHDLELAAAVIVEWATRGESSHGYWERQ